MLKTVKVGAIEYEVVLDELEASEGVQFGWCRYDKCRIEINNHRNIHIQKQHQTFVHKLTHAIMHEAGVGFGDDEERVVNHIGLVLYQVLKDNDFSWLGKESQEDLLNKIIKQNQT